MHACVGAHEVFYATWLNQISIGLQSAAAMELAQLRFSPEVVQQYIQHLQGTDVRMIPCRSSLLTIARVSYGVALICFDADAF